MKFCVITLGCKVNQYETQAVINILVTRGHEQREPGQDCDACIINTCAVTAESVRKSRQAVRRAKKGAPDAVIAVCGCLSQLEPAAAAALGADIVGGSSGRYEFALEIEKLVKERLIGNKLPAEECKTENKTKIVIGDPFERSVFEELPPGVSVHSDNNSMNTVSARTRALLKIQDGCDNYCAYCVIPYARGPARSLHPERAAENARILDMQGFREIVITGIEISSYGSDLGDHPALSDVIKAIGAAAPHSRLRLGSLDPGIVNEEFCREMIYIPNLCDHFHLSLQSGCDGTLYRMGRKYNTGAVRDAVSALRRRFPDCGLTADLITGFPGEDDAEFECTLEFIRSVSFSDMHIFPFSPRPGTRASTMPGQVEKSVRRERARAAAELAADMACEFRLGLVGKTADVLFERERGGCWTGHCGNYVEVSVVNGGAKNTVCPVRITGVEGGNVYGEITDRY